MKFCLKYLRSFVKTSYPMWVDLTSWPGTAGRRTGLDPNHVQPIQPQAHRSPPIMLMLKPQLSPQVLLPILESSLPSDI